MRPGQQEKRHRVGELRPSQLIWTFGIGSIVELPNMTSMILGLEDWQTTKSERIEEPRLLRAVKGRLGPTVERFLGPPRPEEENDDFTTGPTAGDLVGVPVTPFPRFLVCTTCRQLMPLDSPMVHLKSNAVRVERTRFVHANCPKVNFSPKCVPARFLVACENGHVDEFPWRHFLGCRKGCNGVMHLREYGASGAAQDIVVTCECEQQQTMMSAFGERAEEMLPKCQGRHPHLGTRESDGCGEDLKAVLLGASNIWFPDTLSALSVPEATDQLEQLVAQNWSELESVPEHGEAVLQYIRGQKKIEWMVEYSNEEILEAIETVDQKQTEAQEDDETAEDLLQPEWDVLSHPENAVESPDFKLREVSPPDAYKDIFDRVVLGERLREVRALIGFTRLESRERFIAPEEDSTTRVPLSRSAPGWVPAAEVRGEGIFLQFNEERVTEWLKTDPVGEAAERLLDSHTQWRADRGLPENRGFPGYRYVLIHSFSHALMRQFAVECGYSASSIRERIFCREPEEEGGPMAGVLIYTSAPDSEGTLGGLVRLGEPDRLGELLEMALTEAQLCTSDPLCAEHDPAEDLGVLHAAACHSCLFAPETSCERNNRYLDRTTLADTVDADRSYQFFE